MSHEEEARAALAEGDLISAYDAIKQGEPTAGSAYLEVLILARMGETEEALRRYGELGLDESEDVDALALRGRLTKDRALKAEGKDRTALLAEAGGHYRAAFERTGHYFPGVNAAALAFSAGDTATAHGLAQAVLALPEIAEPQNYFEAASRAEALLVVGDQQGAEQALSLSTGLPGADKGARSTTLRQLAWLSACAGLDAEQTSSLLKPIGLPAVVAYSGHIFEADPAVEQILAGQIDAALEAAGAGIGFGALAAGGDILIAERLLRRGGELHVVLPFEEADFIEQSVSPAGPSWRPRYDAVKAKASSVTVAAAGGFLGDATQFAFGSCFAMGLARLRAESLYSRALQIAIWDGKSRGSAGTGYDVVEWRRAGLQQIILKPPALKRAELKRRMAQGERRVLRAMLFADFPGFSHLPERAIPVFWREIMGTISTILKAHPALVSTSNSWGDAIFVTFESIDAALRVGVEITSALGRLDYRGLGMEDAGGMRMAMHFGPVYEAVDPVTSQRTLYGSEVSRTARIEPITPPGTIFVTEAFAAMSIAHAQSHVRYAYVGKLALPKDAGIIRLYKIAGISG